MLILIVIIIAIIILPNFLQEEQWNKDFQDLINKNKSYYTYSVYIIKNKNNNNIYVGMTNNFQRRKSEHLDLEYRKKYNNKLLYQFIEKEGQNNFIVYELFNGLSKQEALYAEARLIKNWNTLFPNGYNVADEFDNRKLGLNIAKYNKEFFDKVKAIANLKCKNDLLNSLKQEVNL
jgi:group I intron endonuclease